MVVSETKTDHEGAPEEQSTNPIVKGMKTVSEKDTKLCKVGLSWPDTSRENHPIENPNNVNSKVLQHGNNESVCGTTTTTAKRPVRYLYKLKSKTGKTLTYTSNVPIVLKKPQIKIDLMKISQSDSTITIGKTNEIKINSLTNEYNAAKSNNASATNSVRPRRGRPPKRITNAATNSVTSLSKCTNSSLIAANSSTESVATSSLLPSRMQTRKRRLKFLPDGRIANSNKAKSNEEDSGNATTSDEESDNDESGKKYSDDDEDFVPPGTNSTKKMEKYQDSVAKDDSKKTAELEVYFREKSVSQESQVKKSPRITEMSRNAPLTARTKKTDPVNSAQLFSTLIGVQILPSQLNIVKFKPKVIQDRFRASGPKKMKAEQNKKPVTTHNGLSKTGLFKGITSPLPKSFGIHDRKPEQILAASTPIPSKVLPGTKMISHSMATSFVNDILSEIENFSDSKIVKTKGGPRKIRKLTEENSPEAVYEILQLVFDEIPSWNLHIIPETNSFCISQVSRGRMGIPILKKSIELDEQFAAKVYVHQLHCKKYDGIYDTENKIMDLVREIDAIVT